MEEEFQIQIFVAAKFQIIQKKFVQCDFFIDKTVGNFMVLYRT